MRSLTRHLVQICAIAVFLTGGVALLGYAAGWPAFYMPIPEQIGMAPNTAWAFLLTGLALWALGERCG